MTDPTPFQYLVEGPIRIARLAIELWREGK